MQNAGQQYGQGGATSHQTAPFGHTTESTPSSNSITSSLRQFRKDKHLLNDSSSNTPTENQHVARVAPHSHYPPPNRPNECYRYPQQYSDYNVPSQVKYSEISEPTQPLHDGGSSVIQKAKGKEYMDMCNVQPHMKQSYPDHLNTQQYSDGNVHPHNQYMQKEPQIYPSYKPESQYFPKDPQYQVPPSHLQKFNMPAQLPRKYPTENDFLSKLQRIHPTMARSIMSDHHLQESQATYRNMEQNRMFQHQNQRYMNYPTSNPYPHGYAPPQSYPNYPASCSYSRPPQMPPRFPPSMNLHDGGTSPRRPYDSMPMNYGMGQKVSSSYGQYNPPEYAQHYQHRRAPVGQDYYQQHCRPTQFLPQQMPQQDITENRVTVSNNLKQFLENWADEDTATEMQLENNICKENLRVREDQTTETVYMINANELQYLENSGIPLVTSENGIPLVASENGQYVIKNGVSIDNSSGMVRIINKSSPMDMENGERVVNLHIMETTKTDCMLANKPNELNQTSSDGLYGVEEKPRVVIHQNTVIQSSFPADEVKVGNSLPVITDSDQTAIEEEINRRIIKETVDKNCSPINMNDIEEEMLQTKILEEEIQEIKNMPIIEPLEEIEKEEKTVEEAEVLESTEKKEDSPDVVSENNNSVFATDLASTEKVNFRRTKRIFSVDDIINNIGYNFNRSKDDTDIYSKQNIGLTKEFLKMEIDNSFKIDLDFKAYIEGKISKKNTTVKPEELNVEEIKENILKEVEDAANKTTEVEEITSEKEATTLNDCPPSSTKDEEQVEDEECDHHELQYRNVIRVEDDSILLDIAGEFVEINVNDVNGKKVITVVPLSHSTEVDYNDSYETIEETEECDPLKLDECEDFFEEPDFVEPTSEIIIGMDLSLEEEIQLDLEQPKPICTKAAKKAYDNDLQIPSITTSEDVYENCKPGDYTRNDKVSSSKQKSKKESSRSKDSSKRASSKPKKLPKEEKESFKTNEEKRVKENNNNKADSTMKIDEDKEKSKTVTKPVQTKPEEKETDIVKVVEKSVQVEKKEPEARNYILADPRQKNRNEGKRKLSLQEYNNRKKKLLEKSVKQESPKRIIEPEKIKFPRPKSLDDLPEVNLKEIPAKRKFSFEDTRSKPISFDWEETQSPKTIFHEEKHLSEFRGLIDEKTKKNPDDEILQNYKEQVESKLNTLNLQIPRIPKPEQTKPESTLLMQRFLTNEKLTPEEVEKIKKIISYKRLVQQLDKIKSPSELNPAYEVKKEISERDFKLHLKKLPEQRRKKRFRNLYSESTSESEEEYTKPADYSVVQANCLAGVVPKLIIKRKTEIPLPVVRLERLDLGVIVNKKKKYN